MTLSKADIADSITSRRLSAKGKSPQLVEALLEFIKASLESGEDALLSGFGRFSSRRRGARRTNPAAAKDLFLEIRKIATSSRVLREDINQSDSAKLLTFTSSLGVNGRKNSQGSAPRLPTR